MSESQLLADALESSEMAVSTNIMALIGPQI